MTSLRQQIAGVSRLAERDLYALWQQVATAAQARQALNDILPALIAEYGEAATYLAAEWYDDARAKAGIPGRFTAIPATVRDPGVQGLVEWGMKEAASLDSVLSLVSGGVAKRLTNAAGSTIAGSAIEDPSADGWQRLARTDACPFCRMLAGRGEVYSEDTADFAAHDWCHCTATVAWKGEPVPVKPYVVSPRRTIDPETGKPIADADFLRAKKWIADNL